MFIQKIKITNFSNKLKNTHSAGGGAGILASSSNPIKNALMKYIFTDIRQEKLEKALVLTEEAVIPPIPKKAFQLDLEKLKEEEIKLRKKLRAVDFIVDIRDARIPVSSSHPKLRLWSGKKPKVLVLNKADLISHVDRAAWDKHFEEKGINVVWTSGTALTSGLTYLIRKFFDANFDVNRRRRRTNLVLRKERAVLAMMAGFTNTGKKTLLDRLIGEKPNIYNGKVPDKGRPDLVDHSLKWYKLEGSVLMMDQVGQIPFFPENEIAISRLIMCNDFSKSSVSYSSFLMAIQFLNHIKNMKQIKNSFRKLQEHYDIALDAGNSEWFIQKLAENEFDGNVELAGAQILQDYNLCKFGHLALELPYMLSSRQTIEEALVYDKDTATGIQNGICSKF